MCRRNEQRYCTEFIIRKEEFKHEVKNKEQRNFKSLDHYHKNLFNP